MTPLRILVEDVEVARMTEDGLVLSGKSGTIPFDQLEVAIQAYKEAMLQCKTV
jgi:hypothetical protein